METLKRNRLVKTVCFLLTCIFLFLLGVNAVLAVALVRDNDLNPLQTEQRTEALFDDIYQALAHRQADRLNNGGIFEAVLDGETESFFANHPNLREGSTNYVITVTDEEGRILLQNYAAKETYSGFTTYGSYTLSEDEETLLRSPATDTTAPAVSVPAENEAPTADPVTDATAPTETETETDTTAPAEMEPTAAETAETTTHPASGAEPTTARPVGYSSNPIKNDDEEVYIEDLRAQEDLHSIFMYIYPVAEGRNNDILKYCREKYLNQFEPEEAGYYLHGQYEVYHQTDFAVSDNGNVYFIGTLRRDTEPEQVQFVLTVAVDKALPVKDAAWRISRMQNAADGYLTRLGGISAVFAALALLFGVCSLCLGGYVKGEDAPVARGLHRFPFELVLVLFGAAAAVGVYAAVLGVRAMVYYDGLEGFLALLPCCLPVCWACIYTFGVRVKAHALADTCWLVRIIKWICSLVVNGVKALRFEWKLAIIMGVIFVAGGIIGLLVLAWGDLAHLLILYVPYKLAELLAMLLLATNLYTLHTGAKALSEGRTVNVQNRFLFGEFKRHAEYLNGIGAGINAAVEERLKSETTKTELITNISHDLKTPLTSIVNYIDLLKKEPMESEKAREYVAAIDRASQRLKKLTSDIVDASKAAAGSMQMTPENTDLTVLLGQVKGEYEERLAARGLTLVESIPETPLTVYADGRLLWRVFDNLMSNVAKYSMPNTRVYLTVTEADGQAHVEFKNISQSPLNIDPASLTDRFVRGDASRNSEGSGLGLNIAQSLARNMGGALTLAIDGDLFKATLTFPLKKI